QAWQLESVCRRRLWSALRFARNLARRRLPAEGHQRALVRLQQKGIDRLTWAWQQFPETGRPLLGPEHLYAGDLNIFGSASLFQLMNETGTLLGEARLAAWLRAPADLSALQPRQAAARELTPLIEFRQALIARAQLAAKKKADPSQF